jgi:UDP-glucose 4-epimerase
MIGRVLVTGGAGFIGTNLIHHLIKSGVEVVSIDNYSVGSRDNHISGAIYIDQDLLDVEDYQQYGQFDTIYHLAALARIQPSFSNPISYFKNNTIPTLKLAKHCSDNNIPLVYAGSSSHHSGKFKNPYTFSKDIGEDIIKLYIQHYNLKATITRFYNVYGPHQLKGGDYCTLIGAWESAIENKQPLIIYGDGSKRRDFTHVCDIITALILIREKSAWGHVFELGYGKNYSINEIAQLFKYPTILYREDKLGEAQETLCDSSLAKSILNWMPEYSIESYINNFVETNGKR